MATTEHKRRDAIYAGLILPKCGMNKAPGYWPVDPNDGDVGDILTCHGHHDGLTAEEIDRLLDALESERSVSV